MCRTPDEDLKISPWDACLPSVERLFSVVLTPENIIPSSTLNWHRSYPCRWVRNRVPATGCGRAPLAVESSRRWKLEPQHHSFISTKRNWFSGKILRCHRGALGSIPRLRIESAKLFVSPFAGLLLFLWCFQLQVPPIPDNLVIGLVMQSLDTARTLKHLLVCFRVSLFSCAY